MARALHRAGQEAEMGQLAGTAPMLRDTLAALGAPEGYDHVPPEIAGRFRSPTACDEVARDIAARCRVRALPADARAAALVELMCEPVDDVWVCDPAEAERWKTLAAERPAVDAPLAERADWRRRVASFHDEEDQRRAGFFKDETRARDIALRNDMRQAARSAWDALPATEREARVAGWLDGLAAGIATDVFLAWLWHAETRAQIRPSLLTATACAFGLAAFGLDGKPCPVRAVRAALGLPSFNNLPAFLDAARLAGEADRRGEPLSDAELGRLVGVAGQSVANWRPALARFAHGQPDLFFPLGLDALPDATSTPEALEAQCAQMAATFAAAAEARAAAGERRRRQAEALPVAPRKSLFIICVQIARHGWPVPEAFLRALAAGLGLASPSRGGLVLAPGARLAVGVPGDLMHVAEFRAAAQADAMALRRILLARRVSGAVTFGEEWRAAKMAGNVATLRGLYDGLLGEAREAVKPGSGLLPSQAKTLRIAGLTESGRKALSDWRHRADFQRLVVNVATRPFLSDLTNTQANARRLP